MNLLTLTWADIAKRLGFLSYEDIAEHHGITVAHARVLAQRREIRPALKFRNYVGFLPDQISEFTPAGAS